MRSFALYAILLLALLASCSPKDSTTAPASPAGSLQITITGLTGATAAVLVSGPSGYSHAVTASVTLTGLASGTYFVTAANVTTSSVTYAPTPNVTSVGVVDGSPAAMVSINYAVATGSLVLTVIGLPAGTNANVTTTGPGGYTHGSTASETLAGLVAGSYTVVSASVSNGATFYDPSPTTHLATVVASATAATATVTYGASAGLNLFIDAVYITQAVQTYAGTIPLVKDRDGFLRVFVRANHANSVLPKVRVRWYSSGTLIRTDTILAPVASVPTTITEGTLNSSWNLAVPKTLIQPNLSVLVDVDPSNAIVESNETDNSWPLSGTPQALTVHTENIFNVTLVPVTTKADGLTGAVNSGNIDSFLSFTQRIHPIPSYNATVHAVYTTTDATHSLDANDTNLMWETVLGEIDALRLAESAPASQYYYGVVHPNYTSGVAGLGQVPGHAAIGWDRGINDQVAAHEIGHNWNRNHSPGCGALGVDPSYPNATGAIDVFGVDIPADTLLTPAVDFDVMSYCHPQWTSAFTYQGVMQWRESNPDVVSLPAASVAPEPVLLVWGRIIDGELVLEPAFEITARAELPKATGAYTVEGLDDRGSSLFSLSFAGSEIGDAPAGHRTFAFTVPLSQFDVTKLSSMRLAGNGREIRRVGGAAVSAMRVGGAMPTLPTARSYGTRVQLTWDGTQYPMAMVRDARTGEVLSFARGGSVDLDGVSTQLEVVLSDGVRSVRTAVASR